MGAAAASRLAVTACLVGAALVCAAPTLARADARVGRLAYLHVEANEGVASGGHAAVRFGGRVYHFQSREGLLVLERSRADGFEHAYALVANRGIEERAVALDATDEARLQRAFDRRFRAQQAQLGVLRALGADLALLDAWRGGEPAAPDVPALGYLALPRTPGGDPRADERARAVRDRIAAHHGAERLETLRRQGLAALAEIARSDPAAWRADPPEVADALPPFARAWSDRYVDAASGVAAAIALERGGGLRADATIAPAGERYRLTPGEAARLRELAKSIEASLVRLAGSSRTDWGRPFLVALARLHAIDASLDRGRWLLLDAVPDDAHRIPARAVVSRRDVVREVANAGHARVDAAREAFVSHPEEGERAFARLEDTVNRVHELEESVRAERDLRWARQGMVPLRPGRLARDLPRLTDDAVLARALGEVRTRRAAYRDALDRLHAYDLTRHNCVTELFAVLMEALDGSEAESRRVLGGVVDARSGLAFAPFASARAVDDAYRVVDRRRIRSHRERALDRMRARENDWLVALRESNTLTARSYRRGRLDSYFVFFTDDRPLLRPPLGAVNLAAAIGEITWGVATAAADGGESLRSGLSGVLMSAPELAFVNVRKGSNDWALPESPALER